MIPQLFILLADVATSAPAATASAGMPFDQVAGLVIAIVVAMGGGGVIGKKISDARKVTVTMEEQFISRREFERHQAETSADFIKLESLITRQADRVETKHLELLATIERAAKTGVDGRVALWNELNAQGKRLAATEAHVDVAARLERITTELLKRPTPGK
jgi:membrane-bound lytic murein transglycosylase B